MISFRSTREFNGEIDMPGSSGSGLGEGQLGVDIYCGDMPEISFGIVELSIGPICRLDINQYLGNGWLKTLLEYMYGYFLPMDVEVKTSIIPGFDSPEFKLSEPGSEQNAYLGFNTLL